MDKVIVTINGMPVAATMDDKGVITLETPLQ